MADSADSAMLRQKLSDMSELYEGFREYTRERFIAQEEILDILCRVLPKSRLIREACDSSTDIRDLLLYSTGFRASFNLLPPGG